MAPLPATRAASPCMPTTAESALVPATVCPPAPRKSAPAPRRKRRPRDLTTVFVAVPQCPPPAMKDAGARCQTVCSSRHMLPRDIVPTASAGKSSEALLISHSHTTLALKFSRTSGPPSLLELNPSAPLSHYISIVPLNMYRYTSFVLVTCCLTPPKYLFYC
ncbi:uncharacterized protein [Triticum aestivum]|uniref:uncharacterized protein n=1 Tax=Triticum aestivum TaxID=4565 RepID=UPI001D001E1F|nr:uncharacterized protein LOC123171360 [Triticum aestivum]